MLHGYGEGLKSESDMLAVMSLSLFIRQVILILILQRSFRLRIVNSDKRENVIVDSIAKV